MCRIHPIQKAIHSSYRLDKVVRTSIAVIRAYQQQIKQIMAGLPQTLESIPGVDSVFAAYSYCRFLKYNDASLILNERDVAVHHITIIRWVHIKEV